MILAHTKQLELLGVQIDAAQASVTDGQLTMCVLPHTGLGDRMRALAFCSALKRRYPGAHIFFPWKFDKGATAIAGLDLAYNAQLMCMIDGHAPAQQIPRRVFVGWLRERFDVVFDLTGAAVRAYWQGNYQAQIRADNELAPFLDIYAGTPTTNWKMIDEPYSQWVMMAASSGVPVDEGDLIPPLECAPIEAETWRIALDDGSEHVPEDLAEHLRRDAGCSNWERSRVPGCKFVVLHNTVGGGARMKEAPPEVMAAIIKRLDDDGVQCVQVGGNGDARIEGAIDRRGHRLPMVAKLVGESLGVVACEGLLPYIARSMQVQSTVLFGPTPWPTYSIEGNVNLLHRDAEGGPACPITCCFWGGPGGNYVVRDAWYSMCQLSGHKFVDGQVVKVCLNMPHAEEAADAAAAMAQRVAADREGRAA